MNKKTLAAIIAIILITICAVSAIALTHCVTSEESSVIDASEVSEPSEPSVEADVSADSSDASKDSAEASTSSDEPSNEVSKNSEEDTSAPTEHNKDEEPSRFDESTNPDDTSTPAENSRNEELSHPDEYSKTEDVFNPEVSEPFDESSEPVKYCTITGIMSRVAYTTGKTYGTVSDKDNKYLVKNTKDRFELSVPVGETVTLFFSPEDGYAVSFLFVNEVRVSGDNLYEYTITCETEQVQVRVMLKMVGEKAEQFSGPLKVIVNDVTYHVASYEEAKAFLTLDDLINAKAGYELIIEKNEVVGVFSANGDGTYTTNFESRPIFSPQQVYDSYISTWCSHCGKRSGDGTNDTCIRYLRDTNCSQCGEFCKMLECHTCVE